MIRIRKHIIKISRQVVVMVQLSNFFLAICGFVALDVTVIAGTIEK